MPNWVQIKKERQLAYVNSTSCITRCAFCRWKFRGTVAQGKEHFRAHRKLRHGA